MAIRIGKRKLRKNAKRFDPRTVPQSVLIQVAPGQKRALQSAIRAIGGWSEPVACGVTKRWPPKTWKSTKKFAKRIGDDMGIDWGALDPACLRDAFCVPLELKGKACPGSNGRGRGRGWTKAVRIGLGSKTRRFDELSQRPEFKALQDALGECEGLTFLSDELVAVELREDQVEECRQIFETERDKLVDLAKAGKLKKRQPAPF